jgi:hypothetical protein
MPLVSFGEAGAAKGLAVTAQGGDPCLWTQYHGAEGGGAWLPKVPSSIPIPSVFRKRRNQPIMLSFRRSSFYRFSPIFVSSLPWCALIHYLLQPAGRGYFPSKWWSQSRRRHKVQPWRERKRRSMSAHLKKLWKHRNGTNAHGAASEGEGAK